MKFISVDDGQKPFSWALWVPTFWYMIACSRSVGRWLHPQGFRRVELDAMGYLEGSPVDRHVLVLLIVLALFVLTGRLWGKWGAFFSENRLLIMLFAFMAVSILWSPFPAVSLKRWVKATGALLMVMVVLTERDPTAAMVALFKRTFMVLLPLSVFLIKYARDLGVAWSKDGSGAMWVGVTTHKNHLGQVSMTAGIFFLWCLLNRDEGGNPWINGAFLALTVFLMNGPDYSRSITALVVVAAGGALLVGFYFVKDRPERIRTFIFGGSAALVVVVLVVHLGLAGLADRSIYGAGLGVLGKEETLTGRTELWADIIDIGMKKPLTGVGYGSFWLGNLGNDLWEKHIWKPGQGHNGYVDTFVEIGFPGLFLLIGVLFTALVRSTRDIIQRYSFIQLTFVYLVMIIVHNITESSYLRGQHNLWFLFLLVALGTKFMSGSTPGPIKSPSTAKSKFI